MTPIRIIVAGASRRGEYLGNLFRQEGAFTIAACVDPVTARADYLVATHGWGCPVFADIDAALAGTDCDAVLVASTDAHHAEIAVPALRAGKHVFCEKPLETTASTCRAIIDADAAAGEKTFVGLNLRYAPVYAAIHREIVAGTIGRVLTIQADEFYDGGRVYFRRWNRLRAEGGGLWITKATHDFDLLCWMAGAPVEEVYAIGARSHYRPRSDAPQRCRDCALVCPDRAGPADTLARLSEEATGTPHDLCLYNSDGDTFDHGIATLRHAGDICSSYTCNVVSGFTERRLRVSGTLGTLDGSLAANRVTLYRRDPSGTEEIPLLLGTGEHGGADGALASEFACFVHGDGVPRCRPAEAALSVHIGLAATLSMDEGRKVRMVEIALQATKV